MMWVVEKLLNRLDRLHGRYGHDQIGWKELVMINESRNTIDFRCALFITSIEHE